MRKIKVKIWKEPETEERDIFIKLVRHTNRVILAVCDGDGNIPTNHNLLAINDDGTLHRLWGVDKNIGFQLNPHGQVLLEEEMPQ